MAEYLKKEEAFLKCKIQGKFIFVEETNLSKIKSTLDIAESDISSGEILKRNALKDSSNWNSVYKLYYDALHELAEAYLQFEKVKIDNHQCLFAYICEKHPELEFSWDFFEKIRTKRNGINYYGSPIGYKDWKEVEIQFILYTKKLKEEIKKLLKSP